LNRKTLFVDVILPVSVPNLYTYRVPFELNDFIRMGQRVVVPFGKSKLLTAIVREVHEKVPAYSTKYLDFILDEFPIVTEKQLKLWEWMAGYYMAHIGDVMAAALPGSFKLASETKVLLNENRPADTQKLDDTEILIIDALDLRGVLDLNEIGQIIDRKTVYPIVKRLIDKGFVVVEEEIKEVFKPKTEKYLSLHPGITTEAHVEQLFKELASSPKKQDVLTLFLHKSNWFTLPESVKKSDLVNEMTCSPGVLQSLIEKGIFAEELVEVGRLKPGDYALEQSKALSETQLEALIAVEDSFKEKEVCLLHGVTGSGKTEIYVELIKKTIASGRKVLYLLPEIALTTQIINRLRKYFGAKIGVYHSRFSPNERVEIWNDVLHPKFNKYDIILGARSAVFLPFNDLGLIIVDEEHETSFKQHDPAPRYNARDAAYVLTKMFGAKLLLGSATPAIETMYSAEQKNIGYVWLNQRFGGLMLPEIQCADLKEANKRKQMHGIFSAFLLDEMRQALANGEQIILFQNRRGYSPRWVCNECNAHPECTRCDVSLTYHKYQHLLTCHYCGFTMKPPTKCQVCGSSDLRMVGVGTERIEEEVTLHLGEHVRVQRMDLDTTRSKYAYQHIIDDFEQRKIDILVGTQMVTKGLDFDNVSLVGVLNTDDLLFYPDFRAFERAFQLLLQVSGRAGRKSKRGKVILQTYEPNHWIIQKVMYNDYAGMYRQELHERQNFHYPPYFRIIRITLKHKEEGYTDKAAELLAVALKDKFGNRVLGPEYPHVKRINNYFQKNITLKFEREASAIKVKAYVRACLDELAQHPQFKSCRVKLDVDPN
jgi:primosomal protein N' (replication factor Y) (superfamily II helicase)